MHILLRLSAILLTTFFAGLSNPTVRWEVRKAKPANADAALQAAVETHSFLEIDGLKLQISGVNNMSTETPLDTFTELVRSLRTEIQDAVATSSRTDRNASQNNQRDRSNSRDSNRYRSPSPGPRRRNNFSNFKKPNQPNERNTARNSNNERKNIMFASQIFPKTTYETEVPVRSVAIKKNANIVVEPTIPAVSAKHVSIVAKLVTLGTNAVPDAKI